MNNIIAEAVPINRPSDDVIFRLEEALEKAKRGELRSVAIVGIVDGSDGFTSYATSDLVRTIGLLAVLQNQLMMVEAQASGRLP